jgi:hypothetical protein
MIPASCVDNFYDDPDSIRNYALSLDYISSDNKIKSNFPGERTPCLSTVDENFYYSSIQRLLSCFFDISSSTRWIAETYFQKIFSFHENKNHCMNTGWTHRDDGRDFAAVVYLNKNTYPNSGTSILHPNDNFSGSNINFQYRNDLYNNIPVDEKSYIKSIQNHNDQFDLTLEFKNRYNRMIAYNGETWHKQTCFWVPEEFRLTQVFFVKFLDDDHSLRKIFPKKLQYS